MKWLWLVGLLSLLGLLAACEKPPEVTPAGPSPTATTTPSNALAAPASGASPLKRKDIPSGAIPALFTYGGMGWGEATCTMLPGGRIESYEGAGVCYAEIARVADLLFKGFDDDQPITLQVTGPDRVVEEYKAGSPYGDGHWFKWRAMPGKPLGTYQLVASQGKRQEKYAVTVKSPASPVLTVLPSQGPPGMAFQVTMAGYRPKQPVYLSLYRYAGSSGGEETHVFAALLGEIRVDDRGEATYELRTESDDPEGLYSIATVPSSENNIVDSRGFFVGSEDSLTSSEAEP